MGEQVAPADGEAPRPFQVEVPDAVLDDLQRRLSATRLAPALAADGWSLGTDALYLSELVDYWRDEYDWQMQQRSINGLRHFRVVIDGVLLHYVHAPGHGPAPVPLVLTHGWPWTFWDFRKVIGPLCDPATFGGNPADAFDVIVPSLPGYAFSSPLSRAGVNFSVTADLWVRLVRDVLGHGRFGVHGSDWGMFVAAQLGHKHADALLGIHLTGTPRLDGFNVAPGYRPWIDYLSGARSLATTDADRGANIEWERRRAGHLAIQMTDPQSMAHAMHDSPVGLLSWLLQRRFAWSDCGGDVETRFTKDELITNAMIYWVTETLASSMRFYYEAVTNPWVPAHERSPRVEAPTGFSFFRPDRPPGAPVDAEALAHVHNLRFVREHERGGHFAAMEQPAELVTDLRDFFRPLRTA